MIPPHSVTAIAVTQGRGDRHVHHFFSSSQIGANCLYDAFCSHLWTNHTNTVQNRFSQYQEVPTMPAKAALGRKSR